MWSSGERNVIPVPSVCPYPCSREHLNRSMASVMTRLGIGTAAVLHRPQRIKVGLVETLDGPSSNSAWW